MSISNKIKELARQRNLTLSALEKELGFGNGTIGKWDAHSPNCDKLAAVAEFLNTSADYLLGINSASVCVRDERISLSAEEARLIDAYRSKPEMQSAVCVLLNINRDIPASSDVAERFPSSDCEVRTAAKSGADYSVEADDSDDTKAL